MQKVIRTIGVIAVNDMPELGRKVNQEIDKLRPNEYVIDIKHSCWVDEQDGCYTALILIGKE